MLKHKNGCHIRQSSDDNESNGNYLINPAVNSRCRTDDGSVSEADAPFQ